MKFIKLKFSDYYLVASAVAGIEIMQKMESAGLPKNQVETYLDVRLNELINQYKQDSSLYKKQVDEIKGNTGLMNLVKTLVKSNSIDAYVSNVLKFLKDGVLTVVVGEVNSETGKLERASFGDYLIMPTEEYALATYKTVLEIQNAGKNFAGNEFGERFNQLVHEYTKLYKSDQNFFLKEFSELVPPEKSQALSEFVNNTLSQAIEEAERSKNIQGFVLGGLENNFLRFQKLGE